MSSFYQYGIEIKRSSGQTKVKCPKCSHERRKKSEPCLSVNIDEGIWNCHNCGWAGALKKHNYMAEINYTKPKPKTITSVYTKEFLSYFKERGISEKTLLANKVSEGKEYMPQCEKERNTIQFNYYRNNELINVKYRDGDKNFKLVKNAERILYGLDDIVGKKEIIIVEGEIDKLSFYEAGIKNCISVPNGASNLKLEYLKDLSEDLERVYIAVDIDEPGVKLSEELSRRLGRDICYRVEFDGYKDSNDLLANKGIDSLNQIIKNAKAYPLEGVIDVNLFDKDIDVLFNEGLKRGDLTGHNDFDEKFSFTTSQLTVITGVPTHGKSNWLEHICMRLSAKHNWNFGVFSPEHYPLSLHFSVLAEKFVGKSFRKDTMYERMSRGELAWAKRFISKHYHWIRPDGDVFTIDKILKAAAGLVKRYGIKGLIIDPYNKIHASFNGQSETQYINEFLTKLTIFKQKYDLHIFLVAHPRKMSKKDNGLYEVPTLYDIAGSANFYNQVDNGITVYRDFQTGNSHVYVQKVKFRHIGEIGESVFKYNIQNGRYNQLDEEQDFSMYKKESINQLKIM
ncbi:MAG: bifunctional DNA primase/helicase [Cytophagia bacterium]|nr:bifunctional DNA primase/helicase [Cytophagia bacterium]